jgi:hypothetical protein
MKSTEQILSRFSIFDLREVPDEDLIAADIRNAESLKDIRVLEKGRNGVFNATQWFKVQSGEKVYEVRRFERFCFCSCNANKTCVHIAETFEPFCTGCRKRKVRKRGTVCAGCEIDRAPYLKPTTMKPVEKVGNIRI